jgi:hypothetical protein
MVSISANSRLPASRASFAFIPARQVGQTPGRTTSATRRPDFDLSQFTRLEIRVPAFERSVM